MNATLATLVVAVASAAATVAAEAAPTSPAPVPGTLGNAIVVQDQASLRASPRDSAQQQTVLWQGEVLEVRGERLDYLQVWDHKRERGGFIVEVRGGKDGLGHAPKLDIGLGFVKYHVVTTVTAAGLRASYLLLIEAGALRDEEQEQ